MSDWYYAQGTVQRGPVALEFVADSLRSGVLSSNDLVWRQGLADWTPAGEMPELAGMFPAAFSPPPLPSIAQIAPAPSRPAFSPQPLGPITAHPGPLSASSTPRSPLSSLAVTSMVLGLVAFALLPLGSMLGIPALVCGSIALRGMKKTGMTENRGMAVAGVVLGIFWAVVGAMVVAAALLYFTVSSSTLSVSTSASTTSPAPMHTPYLINP